MKNSGSTKERFVDFLQIYIFQKYKNYLLVLDNARTYNNNLVKQEIIDSGNNQYTNTSSSDSYFKVGGRGTGNQAGENANGEVKIFFK